jgi:hypothetical protein
MPNSWTINVQGRNYGPYTTEQMDAFVGEGRLAAHSLVAPEGGLHPKPAREYPELEALFDPVQPEAAVAASPAPSVPIGPMPSASGRFLTADGDGLEEDTISPTFGRSNDEPRTTERGRFLVVADMKSRSISGLEESIFNMGPAYPLMHQAWLLISDQSINVIRNELVQKLGKMDTIFIVDATHNKAAWFNFGPESDSRIRRVWTAQPDAPVQRRAG